MTHSWVIVFYKGQSGKTIAQDELDQIRDADYLQVGTRLNLLSIFGSLAPHSTKLVSYENLYEITTRQWRVFYAFGRGRQLVVLGAAPKKELLGKRGKRCFDQMAKRLVDYEEGTQP